MCAFFDTQLLIAELKSKIAGDFRVFFMGHRGNIEAIYPTNKRIFSEALVKEMRESFTCSEVYLDLEMEQSDPKLEQKEKVRQVIENATLEELDTMLKVLRELNAGKMCQVNA